MQCYHNHYKYLACVIVFCIAVSFPFCNEKAKKAEDTLSVAVTSIADTTISDTTNIDTNNFYPPPAIDFKIVGYTLGFRNPAYISDKMISQCNIITWSSAQLLKNNKLYIKYPSNLKLMVAKAHKNNCKILISITGIHSYFKTMTYAESKRKDCINQIMKLMKQYKLDGVDMDWEFPATRDKTDSTFSLFLNELSDSCHFNGRYYLSCAITPGVNGGRRASAIKQEFLQNDKIDWFNIMLYDDFSNTVPYIQHSTAAMAKESYLYWMRVRKMNRNKCVVGLPFYGRPSGIPQVGHIKTYAAILKAGGNPYRDSALIHIDTTGRLKADSSKTTKDTLTQYMVYYNGIKTIKLKAGAAKTYTGGIMFWAIGYDVNGKYSLVNAAVNAEPYVVKPVKK